MKRRTAAIAALAVGAIVGSAGAVTLALWSDKTDIPLSTTLGAIDFAVGSPGSALTAITASADSVSWKLRTVDGANPFAELSAEKPQIVPIQVDGQSQGNRGLAYRLEGVTAGSSQLIAGTSVQIISVPNRASCVATAFGPSATTLYNGLLSAAQTADRQLVTSDYTTATWATPETAFLCLKLSTGTGNSTYKNTATVKGSVTTLQGSVPLTAEDSWTTPYSFSEADRAASATLTFTQRTFRGAF